MKKFILALSMSLALTSFAQEDRFGSNGSAIRELQQAQQEINAAYAIAGSNQVKNKLQVAHQKIDNVIRQLGGSGGGGFPPGGGHGGGLNSNIRTGDRVYYNGHSAVVKAISMDRRSATIQRDGWTLTDTVQITSLFVTQGCVNTGGFRMSVCVGQSVYYNGRQAVLKAISQNQREAVILRTNFTITDTVEISSLSY